MFFLHFVEKFIQHLGGNVFHAPQLLVFSLDGIVTRCFAQVMNDVQYDKVAAQLSASSAAQTRAVSEWGEKSTGTRMACVVVLFCHLLHSVQWLSLSLQVSRHVQRAMSLVMFQSIVKMLQQFLA